MSHLLKLDQVSRANAIEQERRRAIWMTIAAVGSNTTVTSGWADLCHHYHITVWRGKATGDFYTRLPPLEWFLAEFPATRFFDGVHQFEYPFGMVRLVKQCTTGRTNEFGVNIKAIEKRQPGYVCSPEEERCEWFCANQFDENARKKVALEELSRMAEQWKDIMAEHNTISAQYWSDTGMWKGVHLKHITRVPSADEMIETLDFLSEQTAGVYDKDFVWTRTDCCKIGVTLHREAGANTEYFGASFANPKRVDRVYYPGHTVGAQAV